MTRLRDAELPDGFDALLRSEMTIDPSPAFLPRVRERLDREAAPRSWQWSRWITGAAAGALCAAIAAGAVLDLGADRRPVAPAAPVLRTGDPISVPAGTRSLVVPPFSAAAAPLTAQPVRTAAPVVRPSPAASELRVLVDDRQQKALATLFRMVREGRITEETLAATAQASLDPIRQQVTPVGVKPLEPSPIPVGGVLQPEK